MSPQCSQCSFFSELFEIGEDYQAAFGDSVGQCDQMPKIQSHGVSIHGLTTSNSVCEKFVQLRITTRQHKSTNDS